MPSKMPCKLRNQLIISITIQLVVAFLYMPILALLFGNNAQKPNDSAYVEYVAKKNNLSYTPKLVYFCSRFGSGASVLPYSIFYWNHYIMLCDSNADIKDRIYYITHEMFHLILEDSPKTKGQGLKEGLTEKAALDFLYSQGMCDIIINRSEYELGSEYTLGDLYSKNLSKKCLTSKIN